MRVANDDMTLDEQHPEVAVDFKTDDGFLKSPIRYECAHCGRATDWFHLSLALHLCSRDCYEGYVAKKLKRE